MSRWTHVVGNIRVDGDPNNLHSIKVIEEILGPMQLHQDLISDEIPIRPIKTIDSVMNPNSLSAWFDNSKHGLYNKWVTDSYPYLFNDHKYNSFFRSYVAKYGVCSFNDEFLNGCKLPMGSEGSLQYKIIEYDNGSPWVTIPIWGDLRGFDNSDKIKMWFYQMLNELNEYAIVRDAVININNSNNVLTLTDVDWYNQLQK